MRILFIGDSITVGIGYELGMHMLGMGVEAEVVSKVGMNVEEALEDHLVLAALAKHVDSIVVLLGTNPYGIMDADRFRSGVKAFLRLCQGTASRVAWIGPWAGDDVDQRTWTIAELVPVVWASGVLLAGDLPRAGEGNVHFTPAAYKQLAWRVAEWTARVADPRVLTRPRFGGKLVSVLGVGAAAAAPMIPGWIGR